MKRAATIEEIKPLIDLCKEGKLFAVQKWIAAGKPVDPPLAQAGKSHPKSPLHYAIKAGFHSLVEVLLDGGARIENSGPYSLINMALYERKFEIAKLLVDRGASIKDMEIGALLGTWNADLVAYMVERGADLETDHPLAQAFCSKVQSTLRVYKQYQDRFPSFQEQANIALRYHCVKGNKKWVSLMLWLGADPYACGPDKPEDQPEEGDYNALELAAFHGHFDVLNLKKIILDPKHPSAHRLVHSTCFSRNTEQLKYLLDLGFPVNDLPTGGSSHIESLVSSMEWSYFTSNSVQHPIDNVKARTGMQMLLLLVQHGAKWIPEKGHGFLYFRQNLLALIPDYTAEFVWIMSTHMACDPATLERLLQTPKMQAHIRNVYESIDDLIEKMRARNTEEKRSAG